MGWFFLQEGVKELNNNIQNRWTYFRKKYTFAKFLGFFAYDYYLYHLKNWVYSKAVKTEKRGDLYLVSYHIGTGEYQFPISRQRKLTFIKDIYTGEDQRSVKAEVMPLTGYARDFHRIQITPKDLGYTDLTFVFSKGEKVFHENDLIIL